MTFEAWLKKQRKRNDSVGDLACDFYDANKMDGGRQKCDKRHLSKHNAPSIVYDALLEVKKEYRLFTNKSQ